MKESNQIQTNQQKIHIGTCKRFVHIAISPQVTSAPNTLQTLRKGRLPIVVKGARYNFSLKSIRFFSRECNFRLRSVYQVRASVPALGSDFVQLLSTIFSITLTPVSVVWSQVTHTEHKVKATLYKSSYDINHKLELLESKMKRWPSFFASIAPQFSATFLLFWEQSTSNSDFPFVIVIIFHNYFRASQLRKWIRGNNTRSTVIIMITLIGTSVTSIFIFQVIPFLLRGPYNIFLKWEKERERERD